MTISGDADNSFIALYDTDSPTPGRFRIRITGSTLDLDNALDGLKLGQQVHIRFKRTGTTGEVFVDGVLTGSGTVSNLEFKIDHLYSFAGGALVAGNGTAFQNITIHNITTNEYIRYKLDDGGDSSQLTVKAYAINGDAVPASDGTIIPDADWQYIPGTNTDITLFNVVDGDWS